MESSVPSRNVKGREAVRSVALVLIVLVVAARSLFPSEDAETGSGLPFLLVELLCGMVVLIDWGLGWERRRPDACHWACGWLMLMMWLSALGASCRFPAIMVAWEWTGVAAVWLCVRRFLAPLGARPIAGLLAALVLGQSVRAAWQVAAELPELRRRFESGDAMVRRELGRMGVIHGSPLERPFLDRLYSGEASGSFGHPNSLAGFLVLGLPLFVVAAAESWRSSGSWPRRGATALALVLVLLAMGLTRCRSALAAAAVSLALLAWWTRSDSWQLCSRHGARWRHAAGRHGARWRHVALGGAVFAVALAGAGLGWWGLLDELVPAASLASLRFRLEWWQASLGVIREAPWLGVGFGSFGSHYLSYKLPFSSEEIKDPHNFLLELWCSAGLFTLLAYLALLGFACRMALVASRIRAAGPPFPQIEPDGVKGAVISRWWIGALLAFGMVAVIRVGWTLPLFLSYLAGLLVVRFAERAEWGIPERSMRLAILAGVMGLHVHWLAAGGIAFPALLLPAWAALGSTGSQPSAAIRQPPALGWVAAACALVLVTGIAFTRLYIAFHERAQVLSPTLRDQQPPPDEVLTALEEAARLMPDDPTGWANLALVRGDRMATTRSGRPGGQGSRIQTQPGPSEATDPAEEYRAAVSAWKQAMSLDPRRSQYYRLLGRLHRQANERGLDPQAAEHAVAALRTMVECYPNSASGRWELGEALLVLGRVDEARREFAAALVLDQTPHPDKKLHEDQRQFARRVLDPALSDVPLDR